MAVLALSNALVAIDYAEGAAGVLLPEGLGRVEQARIGLGGLGQRYGERHIGIAAAPGRGELLGLEIRAR